MSPHIPGPGRPVGINPDWHLDRPAQSTPSRPVGRDRMTVDLPTAASTHDFGRDVLAPMLQPGDLLIASGRLGVGKTALVQGIGAGLGVAEPVLSPTFVIARIHRGGRIPLVHVDAYRLGSVGEIDDLDLDADLAASATVVEWGEGLVEHLSDEHLLIELSLGVGRASAGSLPSQPSADVKSAGSPPNQPSADVKSAGSPPNQPSADVKPAGDEPRTATLAGYGPGWRARLAAIMEL